MPIAEIKRIKSDEWKIVREVRLAALEDAPDWFWATYDDEADRPERWWREFIDAGAWFVALEEGHLWALPPRSAIPTWASLFDN